MKINLYKYLDQETTIVNQMLQKTGWKMIDDMYLEREFSGRKVGVVIYPELLRYEYVYRPGYGQSGIEKEKRTHETHIIPWIACRMEFPDDEAVSDILKEVKEWLKENFPLKAFYDEDATHGIYAKKCSAYSRDWTKYIFYVNPDFPEGWWENHTLT